MLNVGIIGYGKMGKIRKQLVDDDPRTELSGIFDPYIHPDTVPKYCTLDECIKNSDLVLVCVPHSENPGMAAAVLISKKHLGLEKPMAIDYYIAERLLSYRDEDVEAMVFLNHRWHDSVMHAKLELPLLGNIMWIRGVYGKYELENWRIDPEKAGHGILLSQGIHMLDLFREFTGRNKKIEVRDAIADKGGGIEHDVMALLRGPNDERISLHSSALLWKNSFRLEVGCENGYLNIDGLITSTRSLGFVEKLTIGSVPNKLFAKGNPPEKVYYYDKDKSYAREFDYLVSRLESGKKVEVCSLEDALETHRLVRDIYDYARRK